MRRKTARELHNDLMRKQAKKAGVKSLYELTEADLETLLEASIKYSNVCNICSKNEKTYELAKQSAKSRFDIEVKPIFDLIVHINEKHKLLHDSLAKYRTGIIGNLFKHTLKYTTYFNRYNILKLKNIDFDIPTSIDHDSPDRFSYYADPTNYFNYESHTYSIDAKPITVVMDNLRCEYNKLIQTRKALRTNILNTMMPQKPERPDAVMSAWHNGFSLKENTPTKIRKVMIQTSQSHDLRAKATAYDNKQRQEAGSVRRKIVNQIHSFPCCPYCGDGLSENDAHADHIYPVSKGGQSTIRNMVFVCTKCNLRKKDLTLRNFITKYDLNGDSIHNNLDILGKDF